jgi:hypothetical protein
MYDLKFKRKYFDIQKYFSHLTFKYCPFRSKIKNVIRIVILLHLNIYFIIALKLIKNKIHFQPYVMSLEMRHVRTFFKKKFSLLPVLRITPNTRNKPHT